MQTNRSAFVSATLRVALMAGAATCALGSARAWAETAPTASEAPGASSELAEIVVTANKRSENLQKVPIVVDAYSREDLARYNATAIQDVAKFTPNVQISDIYGGAAPTWVIRGIGLQDFNPNNTPAASIFIDDVYQTSNVMGGASLFDVDRVEVLKGPQGGLYGRNTIGGAVQIITRHPDFDHYGGDFDISYGRWGDLIFNGGVGGPIITDKLAFRLAGTVENSTGGWQQSLFNGETWDKKHKGAIRLEVAAKPTDNITVRLSLHTSEDTSELPLTEAIGIYNAAGGFCAPVLAGQMNNAQCLDLPQLLKETTQSPALQGNDGYLSLSNTVNRLNNHEYGGSIFVEDRLGGVTLTSTTALDEFNYGLGYDFSGVGQTEGNYVQRTPMTSVSEDIRLSSATNSRFQWIVGLDLAGDRETEHRYFVTTDNTLLDGGLHLPNFLGEFYLHYYQETQSEAVYGQGSYKINDKLSIDFALRDTYETKYYRDGSFSIALINFPVISNANETYKLSDHVTGKVGLNYQVTPDIFTYASVSRGYKSGGIFGGFPLNLAQIEPYKEETVWAYETGVKAETSDHRLRVNADLFYYHISNYQDFSQQYSTYSNTEVNILTNLGTAVNRGVEIESAWKPIEGLTMQANVGYLDAQITQSTATYIDIEGLTEPYQGSRVPYAPHWTTDDFVRYERAVFNNYVAGVQLDYNFRSTVTTPRGIIDSAIGKLGGYGLLGARADLHSTPGQWTIALFGDNITSTRYRTVFQSDGADGYSALYGPPASYGVRFSKTF
jgi:iron complex outermembrane receptor protein